MTVITLDLEYSRAQSAAFFDSRAKYNLYPKGRRVGFTRGAAHAAIEWALEGHAILWGDTIAGNIRRYVERYFLPVLRRSKVPHNYNVVGNTLKIGAGHIDLRSSDNPAGWEGLGYSKVLLNEAGIILQGDNGRYLYQNAVLPMIMDFADSQLYAFGAPKGRVGLFFELTQKAIAGEPGYHTETFTSYQNPWIPRSSVQALEHDMYTVGGQLLVDQEIYGRFVDVESGGLQVIPREWIDAAMARWTAEAQPPGAPEAAGLDVARGGKDKTVLAPRWGHWFGPVLSAPGRETPDGGTAAAFATQHVGPGTRVVVDVIGVGSSAFDRLRESRGDLAVAFNGADGTTEEDRTGTMQMRNLRALAYWRLREALDPSNGAKVALPPDEEMAQDLASPTWTLSASGIQVEAKEKIITRLGRSPDKGDAVVYAHYTPAEESGFFFGGVA